MVFLESSLHGLAVTALEGEFGKVHGLLFDDRNWVICHIAIRTAAWPAGRVAVVPPSKVALGSHRLDKLVVHLKREELQHCPDIDATQPVSLQEETRLRDQRAVVGFAYDGFSSALMVPTAAAERELEETSRNGPPGCDPHLRSTRGVRHYQVRIGNNEPLGCVDDFVVDTQPWKITHIVIRLHGWPHPRRLVLPTTEVQNISWADQAITTRLLPDDGAREARAPTGRAGSHARHAQKEKLHRRTRARR